MCCLNEQKNRELEEGQTEEHATGSRNQCALHKVSSGVCSSSRGDFSNKISLNYCKHKSNPQGKRSSFSILGNAVGGKINLVPVLLPATWSCFKVSFIHYNIKWGDLCKYYHRDITKGFNYLHMNANSMKWRNSCFILSICSQCLLARCICGSVCQVLLKEACPEMST